METNGSRFNPLYESTDDANDTAFEQSSQSSKTNQAIHSPSTAPQAQSSKARSNDHHAAKSKATAPIRKPLTIPKVTARSSKGYHGQSSHQPRQNTVEPHVSILYRPKHSTIVLSENTNPNTADGIISHATQGNSQHKLILRKPPDTNHAQLYNFIDERNHWDVEALSQVLIPAFIPHMLNIRPPKATDISDSLVWKWDPGHQFTIKSTFTFLMEDSWSGKNNVWKNICSIIAPQRVRIFIWLAYKEKIMTNYERGRRMLTNDCSCATCGAALESVIHVLRDCPHSRNLWLRVVPHSTYASFFDIELQSWITQNIQKQQPGVTYKTDSTIHSSYNWAKCYVNSSKVHVIYPVQHVTIPTWSPPPRGWMCLNTDGAVATLDGRGSIGGVIRNSNREWITGFTKNVGTTSILHTELWSIYEGLLIARNLGIHRLWIQSNCSRAVKLVGESRSIESHIPLLRAILKIRQLGCWVTKIQFSRNGNKIVDRMTKLASRQHYNLVHFDPLG
ncbi:hypothetical protein F3Y22_tig00110788pilonHSYRG00090 [Hibiscus syriacus]|uniref:Uncharacterized protein n=1 Tax=Hibiscus syriacus TaxID=106335 RepID=A0A6A2ZRY3_HIBSY|nr:hypothetical protein F3Y22_tig00110788pilonHSYRG00090 [Hibiscus syriacus]